MTIQRLTDNIDILRDDLNHPELIGNKLRKLKYNIERAKELEHDTILTFGGAYSNHILATSAAGRIFGLKTIGVIRGDELKDMPRNHVLRQCEENGMRLLFLDRDHYKHKDLTPIKAEFDKAYIVPEGGTNRLALDGVGELLDEIHGHYDVICVPCGTGGTMAGLIKGAMDRGKKYEIVGFPVLKGGAFIEDELRTLLGTVMLAKSSWRLILDYHFGGYAKNNDDLMNFIEKFQERYDIPIDPIYSGKMMYGVMNENWGGKRVLAIHTGGYQTQAGIYSTQ